MVIKFSTAVALSCPACGRLEKDVVNIFELPLGELKQLRCSCGAEKASLLRKENAYIEIYYFCLNCNQAHKMVISPEKFWHSQNLNPLPCKEEGLNPGYFGPPEKVSREIRKEKEELNLMAEELGFDDFKNPEIMLQALDIIDDLAFKGSISCECGSEDINIEIFSERIQLICNNCSSHLDISASNNYDLEKLRHLNSVKLHNVQGKTKNSLDPWINL
jgi:hypothetical protein